MVYRESQNINHYIATQCQVPGHGLQFVSRHALQFFDAGMKIYLAGEAEAGSAGEHPTEE
jgi:hypothetical protein